MHGTVITKRCSRVGTVLCCTVHKKLRVFALKTAAALIEIIFPTQLLAEALDFYHTHPEGENFRVK